MYPSYENLNLRDYETLFGYYTLGFIQRHRPDLYIIDIRLQNRSWDLNHDLENYDWLEEAIQTGLSQGKSVVLIAEDEHVLFTPNKQLTAIVNDYVNAPVYWITMLDLESQKIYKNFHGFKIKMIELPWILLNECLTYYAVANTATKFDCNPNGYNYFCLIGNMASPHKPALARALHAKGLSNYGLITVNNNWSFDQDLLDFCQVNQEVIYDPNLNPEYPMIARQVNINGVWVSQNVTNYLYIDQKYFGIPLAINPETTVVGYKSTEKSIWPILLGRLFLIYGRPGSMAWVQRFYDIDITTFANVEFDTHQYHQTSPERLNQLIDLNRGLIQDAQDIYRHLQPALESARWTLGRNLYKFFVSQLESIL